MYKPQPKTSFIYRTVRCSGSAETPFRTCIWPVRFSSGCSDLLSNHIALTLKRIMPLCGLGLRFDAAPDGSERCLNRSQRCAPASPKSAEHVFWRWPRAPCQMPLARRVSVSKIVPVCSSLEPRSWRAAGCCARTDQQRTPIRLAPPADFTDLHMPAGGLLREYQPKASGHLSTLLNPRALLTVAIAASAVSARRNWRPDEPTLDAAPCRFAPRLRRTPPANRVCGCRRTAT